MTECAALPVLAPKIGYIQVGMHIAIAWSPLFQTLKCPNEGQLKKNACANIGRLLATRPLCGLGEVPLREAVVVNFACRFRS